LLNEEDMEVFREINFILLAMVQKIWSGLSIIIWE